MEIDDIKNIWKEQKAGDFRVKNTKYYSSLMDDLENNERKIRRTYIIMCIAMTLSLAILGKTLYFTKFQSILTYTGFGLIYAAIIAMAVISWSTVISFKFNNVMETSLDFLKMAKEKLKRRNMIRTIGIPVYILALVLGVTLIFIEITAPMNTTQKIFEYLLVYILLAIVSIVSYTRKRKQYLKTVKPIEDKINDLLKEE